MLAGIRHDLFGCIFFKLCKTTKICDFVWRFFQFALIFRFCGNNLVSSINHIGTLLNSYCKKLIMSLLQTKRKSFAVTISRKIFTCVLFPFHPEKAERNFIRFYKKKWINDTKLQNFILMLLPEKEYY